MCFLGFGALNVKMRIKAFSFLALGQPAQLTYSLVFQYFSYGLIFSKRLAWPKLSEPQSNTLIILMNCILNDIAILSVIMFALYCYKQ